MVGCRVASRSTTSHPWCPAGVYPAKAVAGEVVPVKATVWREGHEAVAATLVVRSLGRAYPAGRPLAGGPASGPWAPTPAMRTRPKAQAEPQSPWRPAAHRTSSMVSSSPIGSACGRSGSTAGAIRSPAGATRSPPSSMPGRASRTSTNDLEEGARLLERPPPGCRARPRPLLAAARRCALTGWPGDPRRLALPTTDRAATATPCANWSPPASTTAPGRPAAGALQRLVRVVPPLEGRAGRRRHGVSRHLRHGRRRLPASPRWASTSSTCRPIHPIGR